MKAGWKMIPWHRLKSTNTGSKATVCPSIHYPKIATQIVSEIRVLDVYIKVLHDYGQWEQKMVPWESCKEAEARLPQVWNQVIFLISSMSNKATQWDSTLQKWSKKMVLPYWSWDQTQGFQLGVKLLYCLSCLSGLQIFFEGWN